MTWTNRKVAILLPSKDEAVTIRESIIRFYKIAPTAKIVVVDNNSRDATADIARATLAELQCDGEVLYVSQDGKGNALRSAFKQVQAEAYLICDADLTYPIEDAPRLLESLFSHSCDMVVGERLSLGDYRRQNKRRFHYAGNRLVTTLINRLFAKQYQDVASGFRALSRKFVSGYDVKASGFEFEIDVSIHAAVSEAVTIDLPIRYCERPEGSYSKLNTFSDGRVYLTMIFSRFISHRVRRLMKMS